MMKWFTFLDKLSAENRGTIAYLNREFPQPVERYDTATGAKTTVTVYEAIREVQFSLGKTLGDGWAMYLGNLKREGLICTNDARIVFSLRK